MLRRENPTTRLFDDADKTPVSGVLTGIRHRARVGAWLGLDVDFGFTEVTLQRLQDAGLYYLVGAPFIRRFAYAANIGKHDAVVNIKERREVKRDAKVNQLMIYHDTYALRYTGDVPDTVLDRMELAHQAGITVFTVHSSSPLPVVTVLDKSELVKVHEFPRVDPVVVGWVRPPQIEVTESHTVAACPECQGIVIAMWDIDKEIPLS